MEPRVISSREDHAAAIQEIDRLMVLDPELGTPESDRLRVLAVLVQSYERKHFPIEAPTPIEAIKFRMSEMGLAPRDLEPFVGGRSKVSEVLAGKVPLSLRMIRELSRGLGIPADLLLGSDTHQPLPSGKDLPKLPLREMARRGWIEATASDIRTRAAELIGQFLADAGGQISAPAFRRSLHRRTATKAQSPAIVAWLGRAQLLAKTQVLERSFKKSAVTPTFLRDLVSQSPRPEGPLLARQMLSAIGIALVVVPSLAGLRADGAAFLSPEGYPVVALSLRHDRVDNFWFTLLHEIFHVLKHLPGDVFIDDLDMIETSDPAEVEADTLARETLIPRSTWSHSEALHQPSTGSVTALAAQVGIHPAIVAGRLRYEKKRFREFNNLVGHGQVRALFRDEWK